MVWQDVVAILVIIWGISWTGRGGLTLLVSVLSQEQDVDKKTVMFFGGLFVGAAGVITALFAAWWRDWL